jgi:hypothetical protein
VKSLSQGPDGLHCVLAQIAQDPCGELAAPRTGIGQEIKQSRESSLGLRSHLAYLGSSTDADHRIVGMQATKGLFEMCITDIGHCWVLSLLAESAVFLYLPFFWIRQSADSGSLLPAFAQAGYLFVDDLHLPTGALDLLLNGSQGTPDFLATGD